MFYYADPASDKYRQVNLNQIQQLYVGVDVGMDYAEMNAGHSASKYSFSNKRYLTEAACEPRMLLTLGEQQLILAEARLRGWITSGNAEDYYKDGVKASLAVVMATKSSYAHGKAIDQEIILIITISRERQLSKRRWMSS